ncbi:MAG: S8 family serine peptidase [Nanoarchaeota archaeon]|nr:S8 family serine peptidase [Nanoarchaeota archaeon]
MKNNYQIIFLFILVSIISFHIASAEASINITSIKLDRKLEILNKYASGDKVSVIVRLVDNSNIQLKGTREQRITKLKQKEEWFKPIVDEFVSELPENKFELRSKLSNGFSGKITQDEYLRLFQNPMVESIGLNRDMTATLDDSVPLINVKSDVWNLGYIGENLKICVIDSGVDGSHPQLDGKIADEYCYCQTPDSYLGSNYCCPDSTQEDNVATDYEGHGTYVTGIIASQSALYTGVSYGANIYVVKVLNSSGSGALDDIGLAIDWCRSNAEADIISISISDEQNHPGDSSCPIDIDTEINNAYILNIPVIIASGNQDFSTGISYPACSPNAISVGASTKGNNMWDDSNTYSSLDLLAPGESIVSLNSNWEGSEPDYVDGTGTSAATPHVSGAAALIKEYQDDLNNNPSPDRIKEALVYSGKLIHDSDSGLTFPRIDVLKALDYSYDYHTPSSTPSFSLSSSQTQWIKQLNISSSIGWYKARLDVPAGTNYDLHLWRYDENREKISTQVASSTNSGSSDEYISLSAMPSGMYFIEVRRISGSGTATLYDPEYIIINDASNVPSPLGPVNGIETSTTPTLRWRSTGASTYDLQIDNNYDFSSPVNIGGDTTISTSNNYYIVPANELSTTTTYYWRVKESGGNWNTDTDGDTKLNDVDDSSLIWVGVYNGSNGAISDYNALMEPDVYEAQNSNGGLSRESARRITKPSSSASYNYPVLAIQLENINSTVDFSDVNTKVIFQHAGGYTSSDSVPVGSCSGQGNGTAPDDIIVWIGDCRNVVPFQGDPAFSVGSKYGGKKSDLMIAANFEPGGNYMDEETAKIYFFQLSSNNQGYWEWRGFYTPEDDFFIRMNTPKGTEGIWGVGDTNNKAELIIYPYFGDSSNPTPKRTEMYISKIAIMDGQNTVDEYDDKFYILNLGIPSSFRVTSIIASSSTSLYSSQDDVAEDDNVTFTLTATKNNLDNRIAVIGARSLDVYYEGDLVNNNDGTYSTSWKVNNTLANNDEDLLVIAYTNTTNSTFSLDSEDGANESITTEEISSSLTLTVENYPKIELLTPTSGQVWSKNKVIRWSASDPNDDSLNFTLEYSIDSGANWTILTSGLTQHNYDWNTSSVNDSEYIIRVTAFDSSGLNSTSSGYVTLDNYNESIVVFSDDSTEKTLNLVADNEQILYVKIPVGKQVDSANLDLKSTDLIEFEEDFDSTDNIDSSSTTAYVDATNEEARLIGRDVFSVPNSFGGSNQLQEYSSGTPLTASRM